MKTAEIKSKTVKIMDSCFARDVKSGMMLYTPEYSQDKMWLCDQLINSLSREEKLIEQRDEAIRLLEMREKENVKLKEVALTWQNASIDINDKLEIVTKALEFYDNAHRKHWAIDLNLLGTTAQQALAKIGK